MKAALKKLEEEEKRASMLLKMDERKRPYNSMTETKVGSLTPFSKYSVLLFFIKRQCHKISDLRDFSSSTIAFSLFRTVSERHGDLLGFLPHYVISAGD